MTMQRSSRLYHRNSPCLIPQNTSTMPKKFEYVTDRETTKAEAHWLNRERLTLYSGIFLAGYLVSCIGAAILKNMYDLQGIPFGADFIQFWAASHLALTGHAQDAYNSSLLLKTEQLVTPAFKGRYIWLYPPSFYLVVLPLALLPYLVAYWTFMLSTLAAIFWCCVVSSVARRRCGVLPVSPDCGETSIAARTAF